MPCAGIAIESLCFWMVLWCGHAVLPFPSFGLVFSFHLVCSWVSLALATTFLFSCPYCAFLLCLYWVLGCEYACHTLLCGFFMGILLPFLSPWSICSWCRLSSQSLEPSFSCSCAPSFFVPSLLWLWFDLLFLFFLGFPAAAFWQMCSQEFPSFVFRCDDVLSAFRFFLSCRLCCLCQVWRSFLGFFLFCWCGVWSLLSSVLSFEGCQLSSWLWDVLFSCLRLWPFAFSLLSFAFYPLRVVGMNLWSSFFCSGALVVRRLSFPGT